MFALLEGDDFINSFLKLYKLKIKTINQGFSMTSFGKYIPKALSAENIKGIKGDSSYLEKIKHGMIRTFQRPVSVRL